MAMLSVAFQTNNDNGYDISDYQFVQVTVQPVEIERG